MATLHLMVGLPCSGKTTRARELERSENALRLTPDAWQRRLFGIQYDGEVQLDQIHDTIEAIMWEVASRALELGASVILDFGFWAREERDDFRRRARALGAEFKIHFMDIPREELFRRLALRNENMAGEANALSLPPQYLEEWIALFEPPSANELAD